jgi:hypothetical protein
MKTSFVVVPCLLAMAGCSTEPVSTPEGHFQPPALHQHGETHLPGAGPIGGSTARVLDTLGEGTLTFSAALPLPEDGSLDDGGTGTFDVPLDASGGRATGSVTTWFTHTPDQDGTDYVVLLGETGLDDPQATTFQITEAWVPAAEFIASSTVTLDGDSHAAIYGVFDIETGMPISAVMATSGTISIGAITSDGPASASLNASFAGLELEDEGGGGGGTSTPVPAGSATLTITDSIVQCDSGGTAEEAQLGTLTAADLGIVGGTVTIGAERAGVISLAGPSISSFFGTAEVNLARNFESSGSDILGYSAPPQLASPAGFTALQSDMGFDASTATDGVIQGGFDVQLRSDSGLWCVVAYDFELSL